MVYFDKRRKAHPASNYSIQNVLNMRYAGVTHGVRVSSRKNPILCARTKVNFIVIDLKFIHKFFASNKCQQNGARSVLMRQ